MGGATAVSQQGGMGGATANRQLSVNKEVWAELLYSLCHPSRSLCYPSCSLCYPSCSLRHPLAGGGGQWEVCHRLSPQPVGRPQCDPSPDEDGGHEDHRDAQRPDVRHARGDHGGEMTPPDPSHTLATVGRRGGAVASRTLRSTVARSSPFRDVRLCSSAKRFPLITRVFSDRTLKAVGSFYLASSPGKINDRSQYILYWITPLFTITVALATGELCAPPTAVGDASWHKHSSRSALVHPHKPGLSLPKGSLPNTRKAKQGLARYLKTANQFFPVVCCSPLFTVVDRCWPLWTVVCCCWPLFLLVPLCLPWGARGGCQCEHRITLFIRDTLLELALMLVIARHC